MICRCARCGARYGKYSCEILEAFCPNCGSNLIWFTHLGSPSHEILMDIHKNEVLTPDPCEQIKL